MGIESSSPSCEDRAWFWPENPHSQRLLGHKGVKYWSFRPIRAPGESGLRKKAGLGQKAGLGEKASFREAWLLEGSRLAVGSPCWDQSLLPGTWILAALPLLTSTWTSRHRELPTCSKHSHALVNMLHLLAVSCPCQPGGALLMHCMPAPLSAPHHTHRSGLPSCPQTQSTWHTCPDNL